MRYRSNKKGEPISVLGFGCMRFTQSGGKIDLDKAQSEIMAAYDRGVNYYDTAYIYPGSEAALGAILERCGIREKVIIATKLPQYLVSSRTAADRYFEEEKKRLRTDYIDNYLMHHLTAMSQWEKLQAMGIEDWIRSKKESGEIRNIGFSYHGNTEDFKRLADAFDWDFCQIQYNYMDEHTQAGREGLEYAASKSMPVIIMEPLRGGKLVNLLPPKAKALIESRPGGRSAAWYSLNWLWDQPGVTCVLSGMNSVEMVIDNCDAADKAEIGSLTDEDLAVIEKIKGYIAESELVGCTGCGYCMPCPKGVDIPALFRCYNETGISKVSDARHEYAQTVGLRQMPAFATQCIGCGKCEKHCPQSIQIRRLLREADRTVRPWYYRAALAVIRKYMKLG